MVEVDEAQAFAPVKNAPGEPRDTPESVQAQMIALHAAWLRAAGCEVAPGTAVEISPLFAQNAQEVAAASPAGTGRDSAPVFLLALSPASPIDRRCGPAPARQRD